MITYSCSGSCQIGSYWHDSFFYVHLEDSLILENITCAFGGVADLEKGVLTVTLSCISGRVSVRQVYRSNWFY